LPTGARRGGGDVSVKGSSRAAAVDLLSLSLSITFLSLAHTLSLLQSTIKNRTLLKQKTPNDIRHG